MKAITILLLGMFLANSALAQDNVSEKEQRKLAKKAKQDSIENADYQLTNFLVKNKRFVLEANFMANRNGVRVPVNSTLNFIKVDSLHAIIQTGNNVGMGYNGVGGTTAEGSVRQWKVIKDEKHKSFSISMEVTTNIGMYSIYINVNSSGSADARLTGLTPGELNWIGQLVPIRKSRVYKGSAI